MVHVDKQNRVRLGRYLLNPGLWNELTEAVNLFQADEQMVKYADKRTA